MEFLQIILGRTNATLLTAYNADHVKSLYDHLDNIDLVLLDIRLPDVNGWDLVRIIKKLRPGLPVIAQTAYAMSTDRRKSQEAGCDNYISKPIKREQLLNLMAEYLEK